MPFADNKTHIKDCGSAFHARAPATGKARSPSEDRRVAGTTTSVLHGGRAQSLARLNLGHELEVFRERMRRMLYKNINRFDDICLLIFSFIFSLALCLRLFVAS